MKQTVIEISRDENFPYGYGKMDFADRESKVVMAALIKWSELHPDQLIYSHCISHEYEKVGELGLYDFSTGGWNPNNYRPPIDRCHYVCYCTIYHQDKYVRLPETQKLQA